MAKVSEVRRINLDPAPEFPEWKPGTSSVFKYVGRLFTWSTLIIVFVFAAYCKIFTHYTGQILKQFTPNYRVPFWVAILSLFFFPINVFIILVGFVLQIFRK